MQAILDIQSTTHPVFQARPGDSFSISIEGIGEFLGSLVILFIGDAEQNLGLFESGNYLFKIPPINSSFKLDIGAGQLLPMAGDTTNSYEGEVQLIKPTGEMKSISFRMSILPLDKIQIVDPILPEIQAYKFLGLLAVAPDPLMAVEYQIYYDTVIKNFFIFDGTAWEAIN